MKKQAIQFFLFFFSANFLVAQSIQKTKLYKVSGQITQTSNYCGGMAPTQEMTDELAKPKAYAKKVLYLRKGKTNDLKKAIVLKFISDSLGNFSFSVPSGTYCVIQAEQVKKLNFNKLPQNNNIVLNKPCLCEWWKNPLHVLEIKTSAIDGLTFNFHHSCFIPGDMPCMDYTGPMPP